MKIKKLEPGMRGMFVDGTIVDISEPRTINTRNGPRSVADATLEDKTGRIKLSLWEDMIKKVSVGDEVTISGAYVKEFRNELQLNISRSGTLETQKDRISKWIGQVKGWIAEDLENFRDEVSGGVIRRSEVGAFYEDVHAKNLTVKELLGSRLPDDYLWGIVAEFVSEANRKYRVEYFTRRAARSRDLEHPFLWGRLDNLNDLDRDGTEDDVYYVKDIFAREPHLRMQRRVDPGFFSNYLWESPTQSGVAHSFGKHRMHLREVTFDLHFREVPKQVFQNSGFPPEKLSYSITKKRIIDDDDYDDYMQDVTNTALDNLTYSFYSAATLYRGGEEGFVYYYEQSGVIPKGIEWMNEEAHRWPSSVVKRKVREMGEAYRQVIEEMGLRKKASAPIKTEGEPIATTQPEFRVGDLPPGWQFDGEPPLKDRPDGLYSGYSRSFTFHDPEPDMDYNSGWLRSLYLTVILFGDVSSAMDYYAAQRREEFRRGAEVSENVCAENETIDEDGTYCSFGHPLADTNRWYVKGIKGNVYYDYILGKSGRVNDEADYAALFPRLDAARLELVRGMDPDPLDIRQTIVGRIELS